MYLEYAIVRYYKSHRETKVRFNPNFTVFIGGNGTGKTSFLEALDLFFDFNSEYSDKLSIKDLFVSPEGKMSKYFEVECWFKDKYDRVIIKKRWEVKEGIFLKPTYYILEDSWIQIDTKDPIFKKIPKYILFLEKDFRDPNTFLKKIYSYRIYEIIKKNNIEKSLKDVIKKLEDLILLDLKNIESSVLKSKTLSINSCKIYPSISIENLLHTFKIYIQDKRGGLLPIEKKWTGFKIPFFISILEWDSKNKKTNNIIYAFDHPEVGLYYELQLKLYNLLKKYNNQIILATHSAIFIEKTPLSNIVSFYLNKEGYTEITYFTKFEKLRDIADKILKSIGISTLEFLFEKVILSVEGYTEEVYLPIIYQKFYGDNLKEDGIKLINLEGNSAVKAFLKLVKEKEEKLFFLLDRDTQYSNARLTYHLLKEIGFSPSFLKERVIFIGKKEFEDAFDTMFIVNVLNKRFPKISGKKWTFKEIEYLKKYSRKFSTALIYKIMEETKRDVTKPELGKAFAEETKRIDEVPIEIRILFKKIRTYLGLPLKSFELNLNDNIKR